MGKILAVYGSPRLHGNTSTLLSHVVRGARESGAEVEEIHLRKLDISPCLEIYAGIRADVSYRTISSLFMKNCLPATP